MTGIMGYAFYVSLYYSLSFWIDFWIASVQEVVIEDQDKVFKDVIEPLESVRVDLVPTNKEDIWDFGPLEHVLDIVRLL